MRKLIIVLVLVEVFVAQSAWACGPCVMAAFDSFLPPVYLWCLLAISWFLAHGVIKSFKPQDLFQPGIISSTLIVMVAVLSGAVILGPIVVLLLALPPAAAFTVSLFRRKSGWELVAFIGVVHLSAICVLAIYSRHISRTRTDGEYIVQWGTTTSGTVRFQRLLSAEPTSLPDYRHIVQHGSGRPVAEAALRIGEISSYAVDGQLLEAALERERGDSEVASKVSAAIQLLRQQQ